MAESFSACELVEIAKQIEENGRDFYSVMAERSENTEARLIFEYLAREEEKHLDVFNRIFADSCDYTPKAAYPDEYFAYMKALAGQYVFTRGNTGKELAQKAKDHREGIDLGIQAEKDSILFYEGMKKMIPEKDRAAVDSLILEEKKHLGKLCGLKGGCKE